MDRNVRIVGFKSTGKSEIKTSRSHLAILFSRDGSVDIKLSENSEGEDQASLPPKKTLKKKLVESPKGSNPVIFQEKPTISYSDVTASLNEARELLTPNLGASKSKVDIGNVRSKYLVWIQKLRNAGSKLEHKLISNQESVLRVLKQQDILTEVIEENLRLLKQMEENTSSKWGQCKGQCSNHCLQALDSKVKLTRGRKPKRNPKN